MMTVMVNVTFFQVVFLIDFKKIDFREKIFVLALYLQWHTFNSMDQIRRYCITFLDVENSMFLEEIVLYVRYLTFFSIK